MTATLTTPVEIDTEIARLTMEQQKPARVIALQESYRDSKGAQPAYQDHSHYFDQEKLDAALAEWKTLAAAIDNLNDRFIAEGGWTRYYHVTNGNGHIHTSMDCTSCFPTTQYFWRTDLSGLTEEAVVQREAYNACSVCMPIAPAEQRAARERYNAEQRQARKDEKDAKKNEKLRKAAERAVKFLAKVEAQVEKTFGSWDTVWAEYSLHGHDGRKSLYEACYDIPSQVGDYLYDEMKKREEEAAGRRYSDGQRHMKDPKAIIAEAREKGLVA